MVPKFIRKLLTSPRKDQNTFHARQIPIGVFKAHVAEIRWLQDYRNEHRSYPSLGHFKRRFPTCPLPKTRSGLDECIQEVLDFDILKQLTESVDNGRQLYDSGSANIRKVVSSLREQISAIQLYDVSYTDLSVGDTSSILSRYRTRVDEYGDGANATNPTPWQTFNDLVGVIDSGELIVLAARPSLGKTYLSVCCADHQVRSGERVLYITKEMPSPQIQDRFTANAARISPGRLRKGTLTPKEVAKFNRMLRSKEYRATYSNLIVSGHETVKGVGFAHIMSKIEQYQPTIVWVDGAYLIVPEHLSRNASMAERIGAISSTMKRIAMHYKVKAYIIIQSKRESETKNAETDSRLKDLFGGDAWAQDADIVTILNGRRGANTRRLSLDKAREGGVGDFNIEFKLDPYPSFKQISSAGQPSTVTFNAA